MNTFSASSTIEFLKIFQDHGPGMMFRGQGNFEWKLLPSIARFSKFATMNYDGMSQLEYDLLSNFRQFGMPFFDFRKMSILEQLVHAQHYGLPTRLLDWSTNPLKALFFAVEDTSMDSVDGVVYSIYPSSYNNGMGIDINSSDFSAFIPDILHERIASQDACLISFPLSNQEKQVKELNPETAGEKIKFLAKIIIPYDSKKKLRYQLSVLGITHRTVYPGLEGTTKWIKSSLSGYSI